MRVGSCPGGGPHLNSAPPADTEVVEGAPFLAHAGIEIAVALVDGDESVVLEFAYHIRAHSREPVIVEEKHAPLWSLLRHPLQACHCLHAFAGTCHLTIRACSLEAYTNGIRCSPIVRHLSPESRAYLHRDADPKAVSRAASECPSLGKMPSLASCRQIKPHNRLGKAADLFRKNSGGVGGQQCNVRVAPEEEGVIALNRNVCDQVLRL